MDARRSSYLRGLPPSVWIGLPSYVSMSAPLRMRMRLRTARSRVCRYTTPLLKSKGAYLSFTHRPAPGRCHPKGLRSVLSPPKRSFDCAIVWDDAW